MVQIHWDLELPRLVQIGPKEMLNRLEQPLDDSAEAATALSHKLPRNIRMAQLPRHDLKTGSIAGGSACNNGP